jgi:DNA-binding NarL/FixJ family response regulator
MGSASLNGVRSSRHGPVSVLVVDETRLYRDGIAEMLRRVPDIGDVRTAGTLGRAASSVREMSAPIVLLGPGMAASRATLEMIRAHDRWTKVVVVAVPDDDDAVVACAEAGVDGWVLRPEPIDRLVEVITSASRGEVQCSPRTTARLIDRVAELANPASAGGMSRLTEREHEILVLVADGRADKEIAAELSIALRTVKNHVHSILEKLDVRRRGEAAAVWREATFRGRRLGGAARRTG